eukprot:6206578-Pleurochrysis_carterae.AAC.3
MLNYLASVRLHDDNLNGETCFFLHFACVDSSHPQHPLRRSKAAPFEKAHVESRRHCGYNYQYVYYPTYHDRRQPDRRWWPARPRSGVTGASLSGATGKGRGASKA